MKTPEEYAAELVRVKPYEANDDDYWVCFADARSEPPITGEANLYHSYADAEYDAAVYRKAIASIIRRAIDDARAEWLAGVPGGLTAEELERIEELQKDATKRLAEGNWTGKERADDLLAHIHHQAALLADACNDAGFHDALARKYREEGWKACREVALREARQAEREQRPADAAFAKYVPHSPPVTK